MEGSAPVQWLPPVAFVAVGLVLGAVLLWLVRRRGGKEAPPAVEPLERRDLAGRRDVLIRQLRELDDTAAKRSPEQLAAERYALELETARVLRALDVPVTSVPAPASPGAALPLPPAAPTRTALHGFLWGTGSAAAVGLLLYFVSASARPRDEGATVTGNTPMGRPAAEAAQGNEENDLKAALARNPGDVDARLDLARFYLGKQDMMGVWRETQDVLSKSPAHPRALTYQSLVRLAMGQPEVALDMLKKAIAAEPNLLEAYIHLSLVYTRMGRAKDSDAAIAEATRRFPDQAAMLRQVQDEIRSAPAAAAAGGGENPHARVASQGEAASGGSTSTPPADEPPLTAPGPASGLPRGTAAGEHRVAGTVDLDPALKGQVAPGTVIFVTLREAGFGAGPPMAAKRLLATAFPIPFEISDADSMRGEPLPNAVLLEARADSDGDPMTRSPQDPAARQDDVKIGTTDVRLVLKRR